MSRLTSLALALAVTGLVACASETDAGDPPTLTDLALTPTTLDVGKATLIEGTATIGDADGDAKSLEGELVSPSGQKAILSGQPFNAGGVKSAPIKVQLNVVLPAAGDYTLSIWAVDQSGNTSGKLTQIIKAK